MARFTITLDDDIHQLLKEQADRDRRTLGQEIAYLLELYVPAYQTNNNNDDLTSPYSRKRTI